MFLSYKRGTSRGVDTYGYTLVTLTDENGKRFRTCGDGACGFSTVQGVAKNIGVEIRDIFDKSNRRKGKLLGLEFIDTRKAMQE